MTINSCNYLVYRCCSKKELKQTIDIVKKLDVDPESLPIVDFRRKRKYPIYVCIALDSLFVLTDRSYVSNMDTLGQSPLSSLEQLYEDLVFYKFVS